jgi:dienelactone hydrolase
MPATEAVSGYDKQPWDVKKLSQKPAFRWLSTDTARVRGLLYTGEAYGSLPRTEVFAYYATPGALSGNRTKDKNLPAVVLVHGGDGKAFKEWAIRWAKRGYAAIAMDLAGRGADGKRLSKGGPDQDGRGKFTSIDSTLTKQWPYHAVANVLLAHSLLLSFEEVNPKKTGITGISWGGFLTCIAAGLDNRYQAAVPVYGCGFIDQPGGFFHEKELGEISPDKQREWMTRYDPSHYIAAARVPFLWVNGTNDAFYPPPSFARTYDLVRKQSNFCITTGMKHGHLEGWAPEEIGLFMDQHLKGGVPLPVIAAPEINSGKVVARIQTKSALKSASLSYTADTLLPYKNRLWKTTPAILEGNTVVASLPPASTTIWLLNVTDERGATVSSAYVFPR